MSLRNVDPGGARARGLHLDQVSLHYGDSVALDNVDLVIGSGEIVALVGASGSGKSSLLYCAAGLLAPTSGSILLDGYDLVALDADERTRMRRDRLGFVFQFAELVPELTLRDNIGLSLDLLGVTRSERDARVAELIAALGLESRADARPGQVSGGQAQRAAVARALAHRPSVVFADEPTGALDSANAAAVLDALLELVAEQSTTLVLVTHDAKVAANADRIVSLRDGAVTADSSAR